MKREVTPDTLTCMSNSDALLLGQWIVQIDHWTKTANSVMTFHESMNVEGQTHAAD